MVWVASRQCQGWVIQGVVVDGGGGVVVAIFAGRGRVIDVDGVGRQEHRFL